MKITGATKYPEKYQEGKNDTFTEIERSNSQFFPLSFGQTCELVSCNENVDRSDIRFWGAKVIPDF